MALDLEPVDAPTSTLDLEPIDAPSSNLDLEPIEEPNQSTTSSTEKAVSSLGQVAATAGRAALNVAKGFIPRSFGQAAQMATPVASIPEEARQTYGLIHDWIKGAPIDEAVKKNLPESQLLVEADKTPPFSQQRFEAGFNILGQMGMAAGLARGLTPRGGEIDASTQPSATGAPESGVRTQVGEEAPLRQQGEAPQAQPQEEVAPGFVRLYHGSSRLAPQAGSDFTPIRSYAQGYADKAEGGTGKLWYVDVPEGSLKTHDEYGQPMSRVSVPDEIADQAKPIGGEISEDQGSQTSGEGQRGETGPPEEEAKGGVLAQETAAAGGSAAAAPEIPPEDVKYTGVANRVYDRLTEEGQLGEVPTGAGRSTADSIAIGRRRLAEGANPDEIASRFWKTRRISDNEFAVLRAHSENLHGMSLAAEKAMKANPTPENTSKFEKAFQDFHDFSRNVIQPAKTATSNIFRAMQDEEPLHVDSYTGMREALNREKGRDITPKERPIFEKAADNVQAATRARNGEAAQIDTALKKAAPRSRKVVTNDDLRGHIADLMKRRFPCA